jgi:GntR family transcriptional regulator
VVYTSQDRSERRSAGWRARPDGCLVYTSLVQSAAVSARSDPHADLPRHLAGSQPKGEQLRRLLETLIAELGPGALLPSERMLAERYGVARMTVRKELDRLVGAGTAYRVQGRGTFAGEPRIVYADALKGFSEDVVARGMAPGARVLAQEVVAADAELAAALERPPGSPAILIHRVRTADAQPLALEWSYLPADDFPGLERARLRDASLYALLRERYGVTLGTASQRVTAVALSPGDAAKLQAGEGEPAFLFRRIARRPSGRVIECARSLYRGDRYELEIRQGA